MSKNNRKPNEEIEKKQDMKTENKEDKNSIQNMKQDGKSENCR